MKQRKIVVNRFDRLEISNCNECPFFGQTEAWGEGNFGGQIYLGECLGGEEDRLGRPFVGKAGKLLFQALLSIDIDLRLHWKTNIFTTRPPNNNFNTLDSTLAIKSCHLGLIEEMKFLYNGGCKVLIPLGANACKSIGLNFTSMGAMIGNIYQDNFFKLGFEIIPNYHPSFIARTGGIDSDFYPKWKNTLELAKDRLQTIISKG